MFTYPDRDHYKRKFARKRKFMPAPLKLCRQVSMNQLNSAHQWKSLLLVFLLKFETGCFCNNEDNDNGNDREDNNPLTTAHTP